MVTDGFTRLLGVNHKKSQCLMRELGVQVRVKKTRNGQLTEFKAKDGNKVYLSPILDLFNNEIISYTLSYSPNWAQVEKMLKLAVKR